MGAKEKTDFDKYVNENTRNGTPFKDISNNPKMTQLLQYVMGLLQSQAGMQQNMNFPQGDRQHHQGNYNRGPQRGQ